MRFGQLWAIEKNYAIFIYAFWSNIVIVQYKITAVFVCVCVCVCVCLQEFMSAAKFLVFAIGTENAPCD